MKENALLYKKAQALKAHGCTYSQIFSEILSEFIDTPYVWGGNTVDGADCSGTVCASLSSGDFLNESQREIPQCGTVRKRQELFRIYSDLTIIECSLDKTVYKTGVNT